MFDSKSCFSLRHYMAAKGHHRKGQIVNHFMKNSYYTLILTSSTSTIFNQVLWSSAYLLHWYPEETWINYSERIWIIRSLGWSLRKQQERSLTKSYKWNYLFLSCYFLFVKKEYINLTDDASTYEHETWLCWHVAQ